MLWVNLIMDTLGALALGTESPTPELLLRYTTTSTTKHQPKSQATVTGSNTDVQPSFSSAHLSLSLP